MHLAKGLEFKVVAVMACDDEIVPLQARIEQAGDDGDHRANALPIPCTESPSAVEHVGDGEQGLDIVRGRSA
jgi:superfamily I DNA/RNA helicase